MRLLIIVVLGVTAVGGATLHDSGTTLRGDAAQPALLGAAQAASRGASHVADTRVLNDEDDDEWCEDWDTDDWLEGEDGEEDDIEDDFESVAGGSRNVVVVKSGADAGYRGRANLQLGIVCGDHVAPVNLAYAEASCTDCETLAIALQLHLYRRGAPMVAPQNAAVAINIECTRCITVAVAIQYVIPIDHPAQVPAEVFALARELRNELRDVMSQRRLHISERVARINAVLIRFQELGASLKQSSDVDAGTDTQGEDGDIDATPLPQETSDPSASPVATPTASPTGSPTSSPSADPSATATPASPSPSTAPSASPSAAPSASPSAAPASPSP